MKKSLLVLLAIFAFFTLAGAALAPVYAVFVERIGGDLLTAGGAYATFSIIAGVMIYFSGKWEDRFKHLEKLVIMGFCIKAIGFAGYVLVTKPVHLFIVQIILGIGEAISYPAYDALYSKYLDKGKFASEWGAWESMYFITMAAAGLIGGAIAQYMGFHMLFYFMIIMSLAGVLTSLRLLVHKKKGVS